MMLFNHRKPEVVKMRNFGSSTPASSLSASGGWNQNLLLNWPEQLSDALTDWSAFTCQWADSVDKREVAP
jgi:hypothetical protein